MFLFGEGIDEAGGHDGSGALFALGDVGLGDGLFGTGGIAQDDFLGGFAGEGSDKFGVVPEGQDNGVVALLDLGVGQEDGFDEVIGRGTGADGGHVGSDLATGTADGVTTDTAEGVAAIDHFAAGRISGLEGACGEVADEVGGEFLSFGREAGGLGKGDDEFDFVAAAFASGAQASARDGLGNESGGVAGEPGIDGIGKGFAESFLSQQRAPEGQGGSFVGDFGKEGEGGCEGGGRIEGGECADGFGSFFAGALGGELGEEGNDGGTADLAQGVEGGLADGGGGIIDGEFSKARDAGGVLEDAGPLRGGFTDAGFGGVEEVTQGGVAPGGGSLAETLGLDQGAGGAGGGGSVEVLGHETVQEETEFGRTTGLSDEFDPGAGAGAVERTRGEDLGEDATGFGGGDGLEGELQLAFAPFGFPGAGFEGLDPDLGEFIDGEPEGVVELRIHRLVEDGQGELGGPGFGDATEGADGFETDGGGFVLGKAFEGGQAGVLGEDRSTGEECKGQEGGRSGTWHGRRLWERADGEQVPWKGTGVGCLR